MKCLKRYIERDGSGEVTLVPEDAEDMWHIYNLIQEEDCVRCTTIRKVTTESSTGSTSSQRVNTTLTVQVETIDYDTHAGTLHLKGKNIAENQHVKLGAYHTLDLELNRKFSLRKHLWDSIHFDRLNTACDPTKRADVAAVVMQEGLAHVCLITPNMTITKSKIDVTVPRKRKGLTGQHDKGLTKFFDQVAQAVQRWVNFELVKCVLVASPGFVKDMFMTHLMTWASTNGHKIITDNRSKFMLVHSSSGFKHALKEVLADPSVASRLADTKAQSEVKALQTFYQMLNDEPTRAFYGYVHCVRALDAQAIDTLMISDDLFRSKDLAARKRYVRLVERVREQGATCLIFSSLHVTGEQLALLSGVAAILRYPMPEIEDESDEEDSD